MRGSFVVGGGERGMDVLFLVSKVIVIKIAADGVTRLAAPKGSVV